MSSLCSLLLAVTLGVPSVQAQTPAREPLAEVNGEAITVDELEQALGAKLAKLEEQIYELKRGELDSIIDRKLFAQEAAKRGISVPALLDTEVTSKVRLVTEKEIEDFYEQNKARLRGDEASVRQSIRAFLQDQKLAARRRLFVEELRSKAKIVDRLQPPPVIRVDVSTDGAPFRGPADAPVTLVEFSDFHCPFCKQVQGTLKELFDRYPEKVRLVYRDFPIDSLHPQARQAAEAARCAQDQGKFWEYHDELFAHAPKAAPEDLRRYAEQVRLDVTKFEACRSTGLHKATVQKDIEEASRLGITVTPSFFINGRSLSGAQPLAAFVRVIEEELTRKPVQSTEINK